jgi:hypothetical protein
MARASTVWVLVGPNGGPIATFTVKLELLTKLNDCHAEDRSRWRVLKFADNGNIMAGSDVGTADQFIAANG